MQRWMQAKMMTARSHGRTVSGAGLPIGPVFADRNVGYGTTIKSDAAPITRDIERHANRLVEVTPVKRKVRATIAVLKADRPAVWAKGRSNRNILGR